MKIRQRVYLSVSSDALTPAQVSAALGMPFDREMWRGLKSADPPRPATNRWFLDAPAGDAVDDRIEALFDRMAPIVGPLQRLSSEGQVEVVLQVIRSFNDEDGEEEEIVKTDEYEKLSGQHQYLGFPLSVELMNRLAELDCAIDVDEYG